MRLLPKCVSLFFKSLDNGKRKRRNAGILQTFHKFETLETRILLSAASIDLKTLDGTNGLTFRAVDASDRYCCSVSNIGDLNGDGFDDVIIGAYYGDSAGNAKSDAGESYVVFGKETWSATFELSSLNGTNGFVLFGVDAGDRSGTVVSGAGDVNGDGFDDVIIGAPRATSTGKTGYDATGESYVVFGKPTWSATLDLATLNGTNGCALLGSEREWSGRYVSGAGDMNSDGFDDLIIGNGFRDGAYVVFGKSNWSATLNLATLNGIDGFSLEGAHSNTDVSDAGDVNGDGFDDVILGSKEGFGYLIFGKATWAPEFTLNTLDGTDGVLLLEGNGFSFATMSVSGAGDVNGDGFDDVILGDPITPSSYSGNSFVVFGKETWPSTLKLWTLSGTDGFGFSGYDSYDYSGSSVSGAGDLNGDGFDDLIISSPGAYGGGANDDSWGESYVLLGKKNWGVPNPTNARDRFTLYNGGGVVSGAGDVNGDGLDDMLNGNHLVFGGAEINHAPILNNSGSPALPSIPEDATNNPGTLVSQLLSSVPGLDMIADVDAGAVEGIAVYHVDDTHGHWQFTRNLNDPQWPTDWEDFGEVSATGAELLIPNSQTAIRFVPDPNFSGSATINFCAWDLREGTILTWVDVTTRGSSTSFSSATESATLTVTPVNDAPVLNNSGSPALTSIPEDAATNNGTLISKILGSVSGLNMITDPDAGAAEGVAIYAVNNTHGKWQFSTDNGAHWIDFGNVSAAASRLLASDAGNRVRFIPNPDFNGTSTISFRAWDRTTGSNGGTANISGTAASGGSKAFSTATETATLTITPVDEPLNLHLPSAAHPHFSKRHKPVSVFPGVAVEATNLNGGTLKIDYSSVERKRQRRSFDKWNFAGIEALGSNQENVFENGRRTRVIKLGLSVTSAQVQTFLRGITFSTSRKGLQSAMRDIRIELKDGVGHIATLSQTLNVLVK